MPSCLTEHTGGTCADLRPFGFDKGLVLCFIKHSDKYSLKSNSDNR